MNSKVIKFVAGGGKTTYCLDYLKDNSGGLYLAFNNSVVDAVQEHGYLARTIDSFFHSFIIPKFVSEIPIIARGSEISYLSKEQMQGRFAGTGQYKIASDGRIFYGSVNTGFTINYDNDRLHNVYLKHCVLLRYIFDKTVFRMTDELRSGLSSFLIKHFGPQILSFIKNRFSYVIIDEAQDLNGYKEEFAKLLFASEIYFIVLGDDKQNINGGGEWFENLRPDEERKHSHRCPEKNCEWIRNNLSIEIYGNNNQGDFNCVSFEEAPRRDDGKTVLLYASRTGEKLKTIVDSWKGPKETIKKAKGETINADIVIAGDSLNYKTYYTAITRTTKNVFSTISQVKSN